MKALVRLIGKYEKKRRVTIQVPENEPNAILREGMKQKRIHLGDFVQTITCGRFEYQWHSFAEDALVEKHIM